MKHPWSLGSQSEIIVNIMKLCLEKKNDAQVAQALLEYTQHIESQLSLILYKLICRGLKLCIEYPCDKTSLFLSEICAAYEFRYKNPSAGSLIETFQAIKSNPYISHYLAKECREIKNENPSNGRQWFKLRVLIMDVCTAFKMLCSKTYWNIFYGGETHAQNLGKILSIEGLCNYSMTDDLEEIKSYVESCSIIENIPKTKKYSLLGEIHDATKLEFADKLLDFTKKKCESADEKVSVFIEKHPSNGEDGIQQMLTCNLQDKISIQKFRCNYPICDNVEIYDVDVRHTELGFLRFEFLCLDYDEEFQDLSFQFQEECLNDIIALSTIFM